MSGTQSTGYYPQSASTGAPIGGTMNFPLFPHGGMGVSDFGMNDATGMTPLLDKGASNMSFGDYLIGGGINQANTIGVPTGNWDLPGLSRGPSLMNTVG